MCLLPGYIIHLLIDNAQRVKSCFYVVMDYRKGQNQIFALGVKIVLTLGNSVFTEQSTVSSSTVSKNCI